MMKVVVAGGSGALGRQITTDLVGRGCDVVVLSRQTSYGGTGRVVWWDGRTVGPWASELRGSVIINLCGELVDRQPTRANIAALTSSRVEPTAALARAAATLPEPVPCWIQMSTLAIYGDGGEVVLDEDAPPAAEPPQMAGVATAWEQSAADVFAQRLIILRTGIVLSRGTPAYDRLAGLVRWGLGGPIAGGQMWFSWLHGADFCAVVGHCIGDGQISGIVHATSPYPVRNVELMATLRRVLHRRIGIPAPAALVRLGALVLRTDPALALTGRRCVPSRLQRAGFRFSYPRLDDAIACLVDPT